MMYIKSRTGKGEIIMANEKTAGKVAASASGVQSEDINAGQDAPKAGITNRRERLGGLMSRRAGDVSQPKGGRLAMAQRALAGRGTDDAESQLMRRRIVMRLYKMLMRTPDDGSGLVPGTPFPKAGVADLVAKLQQRAATEGAPGAKVAARAIEFLKPSGNGEDVVSGASIEKLQAFARMADRFKATRQ
jgi:hypothetical protein